MMFKLKNFKKNIILFAIAAVFAFCLCACGNSSAADDNKESAAGISIVTTIFPEYDWVKTVLGNNPGGAEVTLLSANGVDMHSFQPSVADIATISDCDVFVYVGGESDNWVKDALNEAVNENMIVVDLMDILGSDAVEEETKEGMESVKEEDPGFDEHVWLSLKNAGLFCEKIADALAEADSENADEYLANAKEYIARLDELDSEYRDAAADAKIKTLLFADRFPFIYMTKDYGLDYYAAFNGCSADTEASFETISFLAQKIDELSLDSVMTMEGNDHQVAETVIQSTSGKDQKILTLNSMQAVTLKEAQEGTTYLSVMESNLEVLKEALGTE